MTFHADSPPALPYSLAHSGKALALEIPWSTRTQLLLKMTSLLREVVLHGRSQIPVP